ncbi:hypothetical protein HN873_059218, partial [Arachis hypogaea]
LGTFEKVALKMLEAFPICMLIAKHCRNKHKRLKEKYQYASEMLACNGFGKDGLDAWMKAHSTKFYTPGKPFLLFHRLKSIFGKDRATGAGAVSGFDAHEQVHEEEEEHSTSLDDFRMSANLSFHEGRHSGKKRKQNDILERMVEQVQFSTAVHGKHVQVLADVISGANEKFMVSEKLEQLGFDNDEVLQVAVKFANNTQMEK